MFGRKTSTTVQISEDLQSTLLQAQDEGIMRGIDLIARLHYTKFNMIKSGLGVLNNSASAAHSYFTAQNEESATATGQGAADEFTSTQGLLTRAWNAVASKLAKDNWIFKLANLLGTGLWPILSWIRDQVLSFEVISKAAPFFGNVKGLVEASEMAHQSYRDFENTSMLNEMGHAVASGVPSIALEGFTKYARMEGIRMAAKSAYTFAKSLGGIIAEIFTFGAWSFIELMTSIIEAVAGFAYSLVNGLLFNKVSDRCRDYVVMNEAPPAEEFRTMISGSPFVGAVFFAGAFRIGQFHLTSVLSGGDRILSSNSVMFSMSKVNEAQKTACSYVARSHFELSLRHTTDQETLGWILPAMRGYSDESIKTDIITQNASNWDQLKWAGRQTKKKMKSHAKKLRFWKRS